MEFRGKKFDSNHLFTAPSIKLAFLLLDSFFLKEVKTRIYQAEKN